MSPAKKTPKKPDLLWKRENAWPTLKKTEKRAVEEYCRNYIGFLSAAKTERKAYAISVAEAEKRGFVSLEKIQAEGRCLEPGMKIYRGCREKTLLLAVVGEEPLEAGLHIVGGHIDSPRLDAKPYPLYEDAELALLDTHYYGGIKKYQWVAMPLALHGVVVKQNGDKVEISIGEDPSDPVFVITDLLPHLGKEQAKKTLSEGITGEGLNVLFGSLPSTDKDAKEKVKANVLSLLHDTYGIVEEDFASAELELVPAGPARELGLDRSMILGYGHDDRVCAYGGLQALFDLKETPRHTAIVLLCDKEEIGSVGATGMDSTFFENSIAEMIALEEGGFSGLTLRRCLESSRMLSADVNMLHDPLYADVSSPNNTAKMNGGVVLAKYTGSRGKSGSSEASAEFMADLRRVFNEAKVVWQTGELGKVDGGGGGTIAMFLARYGMDVVDCGVGLLSMHAPWEVASKLDTYMAYKAYKAFLADRR
ncbi:MAG: aminopeptidase [Lentisphaeria bacterium]|nr:aminopeptidase [Lentisphaeria bacterium]